MFVWRILKKSGKLKPSSILENLGVEMLDFPIGSTSAFRQTRRFSGRKDGRRDVVLDQDDDDRPRLKGGRYLFEVKILEVRRRVNGDDEAD